MLLEIRTFNEKDSQTIINLLSSKIKAPIRTYNLFDSYFDKCFNLDPHYYTNIEIEGNFLELSTKIKKVVKKCWIENVHNPEEYVRGFHAETLLEYITLVGGLEVYNKIVRQSNLIKESAERCGVI